MFTGLDPLNANEAYLFGCTCVYILLRRLRTWPHSQPKLVGKSPSDNRKATSIAWKSHANRRYRSGLSMESDRRHGRRLFSNRIGKKRILSELTSGSKGKCRHFRKSVQPTWSLGESIPSGFQRLQSSLQTIRRTCEIRVVPNGAGYQIQAIVKKDLEEVDRSLSGADGLAAVRHDGAVVRTDAALLGLPITLDWIEQEGATPSLSREFSRKYMVYFSPMSLLRGGNCFTPIPVSCILSPMPVVSKP